MPSYDDIITSPDTPGLIPELERREIIQNLPKASAILSLANRRGMSTRTERQPVLAEVPCAEWVDCEPLPEGSGDAADSLKSTAAMSWTDQMLVAHEVAAIVPVPECLIADASINLWDEIRPRLVEAVGTKLDQAAIFGVGPFEGIVPQAVAAGRVITEGSGDDLAAELSDLLAGVEVCGYDPTGWAGRVSLRGRLRSLRDSTGGFLFNQNMQDSTPDALFGLQLGYYDQGCGWAGQPIRAIVGDWSKAIVGVRQDITFTMHTDGVITEPDPVDPTRQRVVLNLMQQDAIAIRVVARFGFVVTNPSTECCDGDRDPCEGNGDCFPFAVLECAPSGS